MICARKHISCYRAKIVLHYVYAYHKNPNRPIR
jgi:hypothetical protein